MDKNRVRYVYWPEGRVYGLASVGAGRHAAEREKGVVERADRLVAAFAGDAGDARVRFHHQLLGVRDAAVIHILAEIHLEHLVEQVRQVKPVVIQIRRHARKRNVLPEMLLNVFRHPRNQQTRRRCVRNDLNLARKFRADRIQQRLRVVFAIDAAAIEKLILVAFGKFGQVPAQQQLRSRAPAAEAEGRALFAAHVVSERADQVGRKIRKPDAHAALRPAGMHLVGKHHAEIARVRRFRAAVYCEFIFAGDDIHDFIVLVKVRAEIQRALKRKVLQGLALKLKLILILHRLSLSSRISHRNFLPLSAIFNLVFI